MSHDSEHIIPEHHESLHAPLWMQRYQSRNFKLVYYPSRSKEPIHNDWQTRSYTLNDYTPNWNVGIICGVEIAPGRFLHDVDYDSLRVLRFAKKIMPQTHFGFGR